MKLITLRTFVSLLFMILVYSASTGQSTVTFTSTAPGDGAEAGWTYCGANGWILVSNNYCGQSISPAFSANMNSSNIGFLPVNTTSNGRAVSYPMTGGTFLLFTDITGTTPQLMREFIIRSFNNGTNPVDLTSVQVYQESGSAIDFTFTGGTSYRGSELGSTVISIPSGVGTTVNLASAGFYGFNTVQALPATDVIFGLNAFTFSDSPLPVEWSYFEANQEESSVNLNWATHQEINTSHFDVQRKLPGGETFETIGTLEAAGNSDELKSYQFTDYSPKTGSIQYRIRQADLDGAFSFSKVEEVIAESTISVMPNPTSGIVNIQTPDPTSWSGRILDLQGKILKEIPSDQSQIDISDLPAGMYLMDLYNKTGERFTNKIVKN